MWVVRKIASMIRESRRLREHGGFRTAVIGHIKIVYFRYLRRKYRFDPWHTSPIEARPYALDLCSFVNELVQTEALHSVVEIGCGLGTIIGRIRARELAGYDLDEKVIAAARKIKSTIPFSAGSFADIRDRRIDVLIAVNFMHQIPPDQLKKLFTEFLGRNRVKYLVVDEVPYEYYHNFDTIFCGLASRVYCSNEYECKRRVLCYKVKSEKQSEQQANRDRR